MVERTIVDSVKRYISELKNNAIPGSSVIIFGSQLSDNKNEWSDIDVLVVSPRFDGKGKYDDVLLLWRVAGRTDSRIEPVACGVDQWEHDGANVIVEVARREGSRIAAAGSS